MSELANSGNTSVPNDQKYIKGHLLNDNVGGPGLAFNLFPITADANSKHLAYIEKFVKAQLVGHYVIYYEIKVEDHKPVAVNNDGQKPFFVDSDVTFYWHLLDTSGSMIKTAHQGKIESRYNAPGTPPFDVSQEYAGEYDKVNTGKGTPKALPQGQWQEPSLTSPGMQGMSMPTATKAFSLPTGHLGSSGSSIAIDFTGVKPKIEISSGLEFISVRNKDATAASKGLKMLVDTFGKLVTITSVNPLCGGWTRLYFT